MKSFQNNFYSLLKLAIPLSLTGVLNSAVFFFETLFLARLGPDILAAGGLVSWLSGTLIVIIFGILSSVNILVAHYHGANNQHEISLVARDAIRLALLLALPIMLLFWNISPLFLLLGQNHTVVLQADAYLHAWTWGVLPQFIKIAVLEVIMGLGHMRIILVTTLFEVSFSIILSFLLIFGKLGLPALGISGAGWGMSISYWLSTIGVVIYIFMNQEYRIYFRHLTSWIKPTYIIELLTLGIPMGFMYCIEVGFFFALAILMGTLGTDVLAANQIVMQYNGLLIAIIFSIAQAVTVRMGHLLGAGHVNLAKNAGYTGVCLSGLFMLFAAFFLWTTPTTFIAMDFDIHQSQNVEIVRLAIQFFAICALFQIFEGVRITFFGALRAVKDTRFTLFISIISFWGIALPIGYYLATQLNLGGAGLWWGMVLGAVFSVGLLALRLKYKLQNYQSAI